VDEKSRSRRQRFGHAQRRSHHAHDGLPAATSHGLADLLPHASVIIWPGHGHFSWAASDAVIEVADELTR
jgi:hypothetical protein